MFKTKLDQFSLFLRILGVIFLVSVLPLRAEKQPSGGTTQSGRGGSAEKQSTETDDVIVDFEGFPERKSGILARIQKRKKIVIGLQKNYHPFHIENPRKGYPGIDVEIGNRIARALGVEAEFEFYTLHRLLYKVARDEIDVAMGGISISTQRLRYVNFTDPYVVTTPAALLSRTVLPPTTESVDFPKKKFDTLEDLRGLGSMNIGVKRGTTHEVFVRRSSLFSRHNVITYFTREALLQALRNRDVDAIIGDGIYIKAVLFRNSELLNNYLALTGMYEEEYISLATRPGGTEFLIYLNSLIKEFRRTGTLGEITNKYLESSEWIKSE